ncbi:DNA polymerase ligase N-terminal domain-containing protein [Nonomuraea gerenzanensis]|uniref:ATP-dependent DNA ligase clustered with Ku protein, LigD n=1 Tax=Nonomuraea gerenzanensis TaxID=93944 RepID=A0A1M4EP21_9ACTN|nr:DNA polymerase ligase N-terminal domain-containing protein [Nonomuraea gerenzanensis]UBU12063.1 ATP-dependent DNA ligase [Nonomuraea gerenzanensis]SBP00579.1 ATP-dependent DNA ligase clustered with Ku protein, LigD [Nonomuraea gerenzanensis]
MSDKLSKYRSKRDPKRTPEPVPDAPSPSPGGNAFVIQEHHARSLHWDLRLERDGVLVSWAVPKGLPADPDTNHLAVHTEDHPMEYLTFHGEIPQGEYGGGTMTIWDTGTYETEKWLDREVKVVLRGERASGRFVLFQTRGKNWMIHRMGAAVRDPFPSVAPMLPSPRARLPKDVCAYAFEFAWGGRRLLVPIDGGRTDAAREHPWLRGLAESFGSRTAVLDGEVVTLGGAEILLCYDLLYDDGRSLLDEPYTARRAALEALELTGARWQTAPSWPGEAGAVRQAAREQGLPGVVGKRLDSPYEPGPSKWWLFVES